MSAIRARGRSKYGARGRSKPGEHDGSRQARLDYGTGLLRLLLDIEEWTDPEAEDSAQHKGAHAHMAIAHIAVLLDEFAGWAVDHWLGLAITGDAMPHLPSSYGKKIELSRRTKKALAAAQSHEAEALGSKWWPDPSPLRAGSVQRLAVRNLLAPMLLQMLPHETQLEIRQGFEWSEQGYPSAFFDVPKYGKVFALKMLRLKAVCCMEYDEAVRGYGKKTSIVMDIAAAFGVGEHAVRKWPATVAQCKMIDSQIKEAAIARARAVGARVRDIGLAHPSYRVDARTDEALGAAAIVLAGKRYQAIRASRD